jgi:hypothetical protein
MYYLLNIAFINFAEFTQSYFLKSHHLTKSHRNDIWLNRQNNVHTSFTPWWAKLRRWAQISLGYSSEIVTSYPVEIALKKKNEPCLFNIFLLILL